MKGYVDWNCRLLPHMCGQISNPAETSAYLVLLSECQDIRRFCMMPDFDVQKESVSMFLLRRFRAAKELETRLPKGIGVRYAGRALLTPDLHRTEHLKKLCIFRGRYLPILLPVGEYSDWIDLELNRLLYKTRVKLLLTSCELYPIFYPKEVLERLFRMENAIYQFNYKALAEPSLCRWIDRLLCQNRTVLLGTSIELPDKVSAYNVEEYLKAAEDHMYITHIETLCKSNAHAWSRRNYI